MKKIVPFKKDIIFKTNVAEITSISLEHSLHFEKEDFITGEFMISGEYLMTDTSRDTEIFSYNIPFDIHVDEHYDTTHGEVDIHDFYYEIINSNVLSVHIEVAIDHLEEKPQPKEEEEEMELEEVRKMKTDMVEEEMTEKEKQDVLEAVYQEEEDHKESVHEEEMELNRETVKPIDIKETSTPSKVEVTVENCEYTTYRVYILREEDTLESVMQKYSVTREQLEEYNPLGDLKIGDKLIIPNETNY